MHVRSEFKMLLRPRKTIGRSRLFSPFTPSLSDSSQYDGSFIDHNGELQYLQTCKDFPYYIPPLLPKNPVDVRSFAFNSAPLSQSNPLGKVAEGCSHSVYRARAPSGKIYYIKDLSQSNLHGLRDEHTAQFIAHQETFASWLMFHIFGPELIPEVFPVKFKDKWGIASSEIKYFGTLHHLAQQLGYSDLQIEDGESALKVLNGQTFLMLPEGKEPIRVKGRITLKVALHLLVAHYDLENSHKNIFMKLIPDPLHYRQVACPGMFDLGCVFDPFQMTNYIRTCSDPSKKAELAAQLAINPVDAHIHELNVKDYEKITDRFFAKQTAFRRLAGLQRSQIEFGLEWFKENSPEEAHSFIKDKIANYLYCSTDLANSVSHEITNLIKTRAYDKEPVFERGATTLKR